MGWHTRKLVLLALVLWTSIPLNGRTFLLKTQYITYGSGVVDNSIYSKHMILVPIIQGVQERVSAKLYVNGVPVSYAVSIDPEGNEYANPGSISFSGSINLTLVQEVKVVSPPFRAKFELPKNASWEALHANLPRNPFWRCNSSRIKLEDLERLSWELRSRAETPDQYLLDVIRWTLERFNYSENSSGGVRCPASFLETLTGPCGDVHAFTTALLKIQGIDAVLVYAYIVSPHAVQELSSQTIRYTLRGAYPHIFSVANFSGKIVPIDLTASIGKTAEDKISGSSFNVLDNIIIFYKIKEGDPNDYLLIHTVKGATQAWLQVDVEEVRNETAMKMIILAASIFVLVLLLRLYSSSSRFEN